MTWSQRLKRVFGIDIETCAACGGALRIIACIEDPAVINKILTHIDSKNACAAPPVAALSGATAGAWVLIEPTTRPTSPAPTLTGQAGKRSP
jgi:Ser/Thr protein kinase RdoA (MazF antagonist)